MPNPVVFSMQLSLDGYIAGPDGDIGWTGPDEELHRFHNEQAEAAGVHLLGRRLYEVMRYWDTAADDPSLPEFEREFARIWTATPRIVFSRTLESVEGGAELARDGLVETIARLKQQDAAEIALGGATLAASAIDEIDEFRLFWLPIAIGAGTPFFPSLEQRVPLTLLESRTFGSGVVFARYARA